MNRVTLIERIEEARSLVVKYRQSVVKVVRAVFAARGGQNVSAAMLPALAPLEANRPAATDLRKNNNVPGGSD